MTAPAPEELLLTITPDGERCGECDHRTPSSETAYIHCDLFGDTLAESHEYGKECLRCPSCLDAARAARELREENARLREVGWKLHAALLKVSLALTSAETIDGLDRRKITVTGLAAVAERAMAEARAALKGGGQ